jgi:hypothetical protein
MPGTRTLSDRSDNYRPPTTDQQIASSSQPGLLNGMLPLAGDASSPLLRCAAWPRPIG